MTPIWRLSQHVLDTVMRINALNVWKKTYSDPILNFPKEVEGYTYSLD